MANTRRVVRRIDPPGDLYFEEQLWPIFLGLAALGGCLIGFSLGYQPLSGVPWRYTAWPTVIGVPVVVLGAMVALVWFENRLIRRSLQFSLVLCAIFHFALIVHMLRTQLASGAAQLAERQPQVVPSRPTKLVPEYHPTQLVPEEDRPRQDFEKPVEAESPQPTRDPEQIVRQPTDEERSPALAQPVPIAEQRPTTEPNVIDRPNPNEVAPRLAAQTSRLSRQTQPSQSRTSQAVVLPAIERQAGATLEAQASSAQVEQQSATAANIRPAAKLPEDRLAPSAPNLTRQANETAPRESPLADQRARQTASAPTRQPSIETALERPAEQQASVVEAQSQATTATQRRLSAPAPIAPSDSSVTAESSHIAMAAPRRVQDKSAPTVAAIEPSSSATLSRAAAAEPRTTNSAAIPTSASAFERNRAQAANAEPSRTAVSRAEAGIAGNRRSPNLDTSQPGAKSPSLVSSTAARRAEATQRAAAGDALSPAAPARIPRSVAAAETPTSGVRAEPVAGGVAPATTQIAEVTASSSAALTKADAAARRDAVTAAKGTGEIDFGPTQQIAEVGAGRVAGGGQPEISPSASASASLTRRTSGGPSANAAATPLAAGSPPTATTPTAEAAPSLAAATRRDAASGGVGYSPSNLGPTSPSVESPSTAIASGGSLARAAASNVPATGEPSAREQAPGAAVVMSRQGTAVSGAGSDTSVAAIPEVGPRSAVAQAETDHLAGAGAPAPLSRTSGDALAIDVVAPVGPGGLGTDYSPEVGINVRQAQTESVHVELRAARFLRSNVGGLPAVSTAAVIPTEAFSSRAARVRGETPAGGRGSQSPETEEAIERGLAFLARHQRTHGGWSLQGFPEGATLVSDTAATALSLLAFQGAGYNHREFQYREVVHGGLTHLLANQKPDGDLFVPLDDASNRSVWLYSHSLAAIAVCEAYGMTQDPALREPAQKAIDFIVNGQERERGGWRYAPGVGADTSVSGWMMMALKSGELAGLEVPETTYERIGRWLDSAQQSASEPHLYRYNPLAPDTAEQRHGRVVSKTMTAVGLLMRLYTGWRRDNANMIRGASYLRDNLPAIGTARQPERDTYYWYYATQVMAHVGGEAWEAWMSRLHPLLVGSQIRQGQNDGSWDPRGPIADRWGPHAGRLYVTTMNLLSLEVQHRKLPLYEDISR